MAKDNRINLPSGGAGLTRYFDEYKSTFSFKPGHVILIAMLIIVIVVILHTYGKSWIGLP